MNFAEYKAIPAINATALKAGIGLSMLHMRHAVISSDDNSTEALRNGKLVHGAVLEPKSFFSQVAIFEGDKVKQPKEWKAFKEAHDPDLIITKEENLKLFELSAAVHANPDAHRLIASTRHEATTVWQGEDYGQAKCRFDGIGKGLFFDLKTTTKMHPRAFAKQFVELGYDVQCGWYAEGQIVTEKLQDLPEVYIICVQSKKPFDVAVYRVPRAVIELGRKNARKTAIEYRYCEQDNRFPGVSEGVKELEMPSWYGQDDIVIDFNMEGTTDE